jgi:hypothetical protein
VVELVPASRAHIGRIANRMRAADVLECEALGYSPRQALRQCLTGSTMALTAKVDGQAEAMLGLTPVSLLEGKGRPWMLGSELIYSHWREMLAWGPRIIAVMRDSTPHLSNVVAEDNVRAIRLLRRWGFEVGTEAEMIGSVPFLTFEMA